MCHLGKHIERRLVVLSDIAGFGSMDAPRRRAARAGHDAAFAVAASRAFLGRATWARQTTGDGELAILPIKEPECRVVDDFVRELAVAIARHNEDRLPQAHLRLRFAIVHGVANPDTFDGQGLVEARRLVDSAPVRAILRTSGVPLAVIISDRIFNDTIAQRYTSLRVNDFQRVDVREKELTAMAWVRAPGVDIHSLDIPDGSGTPTDQTSDAPRAEGPERVPRRKSLTPGPSQSAVRQMLMEGSPELPD